MVPSTRDTHFQNRVSSRLRETLLLLKTCCLVYAKPPLWEATRSRVHPSPALLSQVEHGKSRVSSTRNACLQNTKKKSPLVYAKHTLPNASVVSSTRDGTFVEKLLSRLRETPTLGGNAEPSPSEPSLAQPIRAEQKSKHKIKLRFVYVKCYVFS